MVFLCASLSNFYQHSMHQLYKLTLLEVKIFKDGQLNSDKILCTSQLLIATLIGKPKFHALVH